MKPLVLFDIDGTLTRTRNGFIPFNEAISKTFGFPGDIRTVRPDGNTDPLILQDIFAQANIPVEVTRERWEAFAENLMDSYSRSIRHGITEVYALPGVLNLVQKIAGIKGARQGVVTGNLETTGRLKLESAGLGGYLELGAYASDSPHRADLPRIARERWEKVVGKSISPDQCIIVGDTPKDLAAARENQMKCLLVGTGRYPIEELELYNPDAFLSDFSDTDLAVETLFQLV